MNPVVNILQEQWVVLNNKLTNNYEEIYPDTQKYLVD